MQRVQALLGNKNSKAANIQEVGQALDAINDSTQHDFVAEDYSTGFCVICSEIKSRHKHILEQTIRPFENEGNHLSDTVLRSASNQSEELSQDVRIQDLIRRMHREMLLANEVGDRIPRDSMDGSVYSNESYRS